MELIEHKATKETPFHFVDSGLDNVYLVGIKYYTHPDGKFAFAEIPAATQLMNLIARLLVFSAGPLKGKEVRFLRKRLGRKSTDFAKLLRIEAESLSRIENEKQAVSGQVETLTRVAYIASADDSECAEARKRLVELLERERQKRKSQVITMKVSSNNEWKQAA